MQELMVQTGRDASPDGCDGRFHRGDLGEEYCEVYLQGVPAHLDMAGPMWDEWLPPPVEDRGGNFRAVFVCGPETMKGTARCGQEYRNALVVLSGAEWEASTFRDLLARIEAAFETHFDRGE